MDKYRVTLTAEKRVALECLISAGKSAARNLTNARILLLADATDGDERADEEIVDALGTSPRTIARARQRFVTEGIPAALDRSPQPPRPDKIKIKGDLEQLARPAAASAARRDVSTRRWPGSRPTRLATGSQGSRN